jgi:RNA polymerase sigma-70 factor (ECF subfamily)
MDKFQRKFDKIYNTHIERIYRFIYIKVNSQEVAEDLTSEVFLRTWKFFNKNNPTKIKNINAFLYKTARNLVIDFYRTRDKLSIVPPDNYKNVPDPNQELEKKEIVQSDIERTLSAISQLKDDYQNVLIWHYLDNLSIKEIAKIMDKSENAVRVTLHRALNTLKQLL